MNIIKFLLHLLSSLKQNNSKFQFLLILILFLILFLIGIITFIKIAIPFTYIAI